MDAQSLEAASHLATTLSEWSLGVSASALLASAVIAFLEVRRRMGEGVKLALSAIPVAKLYGDFPPDDATYIALNVANRGDQPTTDPGHGDGRLRRTVERISPQADPNQHR